MKLTEERRFEVGCVRGKWGVCLQGWSRTVPEVSTRPAEECSRSWKAEDLGEEFVFHSKNRGSFRVYKV